MEIGKIVPLSDKTKLEIQHFFERKELRRQKEEAEAAAELCHWSYRWANHLTVAERGWHTDCDHWYFYADCRTFEFCPYCGKPIVLINQ